MTDGRVDQALDLIELRPLIEELLALGPLSRRPAEGKAFHPFVRGLILSGKLADQIHGWLPSGQHVAWGQLTDNAGMTLSSENDVIIYQGPKDGQRTWTTRCARYAIVRKAYAEVVVQCRTRVSSIDADLKAYVADLRAFCPRVWLFAECCTARTAERRKQIQEDAKKAGYEHFFYLYDFEEGDRPSPNLKSWQDFKAAVAQILRLGEGAEPRSAGSNHFILGNMESLRT